MPTRQHRADLANSIIDAVDRENEDKLQAALDDAQERLEDPKEFLTTTVNKKEFLTLTKSKKKYTLLDYTIQSGWVQGISLLLERGANLNVATKNDRGSYPLTTAIDYKHKEVSIIQMLLEKGAYPNVKDKTDCSPLYLASCQGSLNIVLLLIEKGADLRMRNKGREKLTALRGAINAKHYRTACTLVEHLCKQKLPFSLQADQRSKLKKHASSDIQSILKSMSPSKKDSGRYTFSPEKMSDIVTVADELDLVSGVQQSVPQIKASSSKQGASHPNTIRRRRNKVDRAKPVSSYGFVYPPSSDFLGSKKEGKQPQKDFSLKRPKAIAEQSEDSSSEDVLSPIMRRAQKHADEHTRPFSLNKTRRTRANAQNSDQKPSRITIKQESGSSNRLKGRLQFEEESFPPEKPLQPIIDQYESLHNQQQYTLPIARGAESELPEHKEPPALNRFRTDSLLDKAPQIITDQDDMSSSEETIPAPIVEKRQSTVNPRKQSFGTHNQSMFSIDNIDLPQAQAGVDSDEETPIEEINQQIAALEQNTATEQPSSVNREVMSSTDESESEGVQGAQAGVDSDEETSIEEINQRIAAVEQNTTTEQSSSANHEVMSSTDESESEGVQGAQADEDSGEETSIEEINQQIAALETKGSQASLRRLSNQSTIDFANAFREKLANPNESFLSRLEQSASASGAATNQPACGPLEDSATKITDSARHLRAGFLSILERGKEQPNNPQETESIALKNK